MMKKLKRAAAFFLAIIIMASCVPYKESRAEDADSTNVSGILRVDVVDEYGARLADASFAILKEEDYSSVFSWTSDGINEQMVTLEPGSYIITQSSAPEGKTISPWVFFEVREDGVVSMGGGAEAEDNRIEIVNSELVLDIDPPILPPDTDQGCYVYFETIDPDGNYLIGAEVQVKDADGTVIDTWISDEYGYTLHLEIGDYYFEVVNPVTGYLKADTIPFTVTADFCFDFPLAGVKWDSSEAYLSNYFKTVVKRSCASAIEWEEDAEKKATLIRLFGKYNTQWDALIDTAAADYFADLPSGELDDGPQKVPSEFLRQIYDAMKQDIEEELRIAEEGTPAYDAASCIRQNLGMDYESYVWQMDGGLSNGVSMVNYKAPVGPGGSTAKIDLTVTKTWEDENNRFKLRPDEVVVELLADTGDGPELTGQTLTLTENTWKDDFSGLPTYEYENGVPVRKIAYTVREVSVEHYTSTIAYEGEDAVSIKNRLVTYPVAISKQNDENENLAGAVLQIFDAGNNPVTERWVSGQTDKTIQLPSGTYRLHEEAPPIKYKKADDLFFTVEGNGIIKVNNANVEKVVLKNYRQSPQGLGIGGERVFSKLLLLLLALGIIRLLFRDEKRRKEE